MFCQTVFRKCVLVSRWKHVRKTCSSWPIIQISCEGNGVKTFWEKWMALRLMFRLLRVNHCTHLSGNPKGAMLTHENVVADAAGVLKTIEVHEKWSGFWFIYFFPFPILNVGVKNSCNERKLVLTELVCKCRYRLFQTPRMSPFHSCHWHTCLRESCR